MYTNQLIFRIFIGFSVLVILSGMYQTIYNISAGEAVSGAITQVSWDVLGGTKISLQSINEVDVETMNTATAIIGKRLNGLGIYVFSVTQTDSTHIAIVLPGITDVTNIDDTLTGIGRLEFIDTKGEFLNTGSIVRTTGNPNPTIPGVDPATEPDPNNSQPTVSDVVYTSITDGSDLDTRQVSLRVTNNSVASRPAVTFAFLGQSASNLATFSAANIQKPMCIALDNVIVSCLVIQDALIGGNGEITTDTREDAEKIMIWLKYGTLPVDFFVEYVTTQP